MQEQAEAEPDPRKVIALLVDFWRGGLRAHGSHLRGDPAGGGAGSRHRSAGDRARSGAASQLSPGRPLLAERGDLRQGLTPEAAAAIIFSLGHPESYRLLVQRSGWSTDRWAAWVTDALVAALLRDA